MDLFAMTLDEFLDALRKTPRAWCLEDKAIRCPSTDDEPAHCPLSYVAEVHPCATSLAMAKLSMLEDLALDIAAAADGAINGCLVPLRARLLDACSLTEPSV